MQLVIIRGLPGSGKSTLAKRLSGFKHFEADMFHMKDGVYCFDPANVKAAHNWCQSAVYDALTTGFDVVVSNTFTQHWEMKPYYDFCKELGITPLVIVAKNNFGSIHNVPEETMLKMRERWED